VLPAMSEIKEQRKDRSGVVAALNYMGLIQTERQDGQWPKSATRGLQFCLWKWRIPAGGRGSIQPRKHTSFAGRTGSCHGLLWPCAGDFDSLGNKQGSSQTQSNLGLIYQRKGDLSLAQDYFQKSIDAKEELGDDQGVATTKLNLGLVLQIKGEWDLAKSLFEEASLAFEDLGDVRGVAAAQNNLGNLHSDRGDSLKAVLCYNLSLEPRAPRMISTA